MANTKGYVNIETGSCFTIEKYTKENPFCVRYTIAIQPNPHIEYLVFG